MKKYSATYLLTYICISFFLSQHSFAIAQISMTKSNFEFNRAVSEQCQNDLDCDLNVPCINGICGCRQDTNCPIDHPFCHKGTCFECEANYDCLDDPFFPFCRDGSCVECLHDSNCPSSRPICSEDTCFECVNDSQCGTEMPVCVSNTCQICEFLNGTVSGPLDWISNDLDDQQECARLVKAQYPYAAGVYEKDGGGCGASYGNTISDGGSEEHSCLFPDHIEHLWKQKLEGQKCSHRHEDTTKQGQKYCQDMCTLYLDCIGISYKDDYPSECFMCFEYDVAADEEFDFYFRPLECADNSECPVDRPRCYHPIHTASYGLCIKCEEPCYECNDGKDCTDPSKPLCFQGFCTESISFIIS